jgi:hypothetical protein
MKSSTPAKQDYEYARKGTTNLFVAVEPKAGQRFVSVSVTERRGKTDFVAFVQALLTDTYSTARRIHLVLDNLNTHFRKSFDDVLGRRAAGKLLRRVSLSAWPGLLVPGRRRQQPFDSTLTEQSVFEATSSTS